jgi:hypothetical protein
MLPGCFKPCFVIFKILLADLDISLGIQQSGAEKQQQGQ